MKSVFAFFLTLELAVPAVFAQQKDTLRPHWEPGKVYRQETVMDMEVTQTGVEGVQTTKLTQVQDARVTAEAGTENKLAAIRFASVKAVMGAGGQTMSYDSEDPAKSPPFLQQTFGAIVGKSFTMVYDKDDKFVEARDLQELLATPVGDTSGPDGKQLSEAFRRSYEMTLPAKPVQVGDTWTAEDTINMAPLTFVLKLNGKYEGVVTKDGRKVAKILLEGTLTSPPGVVKVTVENNSSFKGEAYFDMERRFMHSNNIQMTMNMKVDGRDVSMKQTIGVRLVSIEDAK